MGSCILYTQKRGEVDKSTLETGISFFIYTFMAMMLLIVIQLLTEFGCEYVGKEKASEG